MEIVDAHTHVASTRYMPRPFLEGIADNMLEQLRPLGAAFNRNSVLDRVLSGYQDHDASAQLAAMDELGVSRSVLLLPDFTYALKGGELTIAEMFAEHGALLQRHPDRFVVFAGVDPRWGADALNLFIHGVEKLGFRGLKLYPPCGYQADSPLLEPFYEYCNSHALPVLAHTLKEAYAKAHGGGFSIPFDAFCFDLSTPGTPKIEFSSRHPGRTRDWQFRRMSPSPNHVLALAVALPEDPALHVEFDWIVPPSLVL